MLESGDGHPFALLGKSSELSYLPLPSVTFLSHAGVVFVAILRMFWETLGVRTIVRLIPHTVNGFLFGVLTQQFYSYWISGEFDS